MDLRTKKTRQSIFNAFLELRARCPLEKITVKELCAKAVIHKSTFYAHYQDLYDLADTLETEVVDQVLDSKNTDENWLEQIALREAIAKLSDREKRILSLRFFQGKTQMEVSTEVGISQAQVSRLEKNALRQIKKDL